MKPAEDSCSIYLDQSHLSELAFERREPGLGIWFREACRAGLLRPVFSLTHLYETLNYRDTGARASIASYADSLPRILWILPQWEILKKEIAAAFFHQHGITAAVPEAVLPKLHVAAPPGREDPRIPLEIERFSESLALLGEQPGYFSGFQAWRNLADRLPGGKQASGPHDTGEVATVLTNLKGLLRQIVAEGLPSHFPDGRRVNRLQRERFLQKTPWDDFALWPGVYLLNRVAEQMRRDVDTRVTGSQLFDLVHMSALPYVDLFLCDKQTRDLIRRANPPEAVLARCFGRLADALETVAGTRKDASYVYRNH